MRPVQVAIKSLLIYDSAIACFPEPLYARSKNSSVQGIAVFAYIPPHACNSNVLERQQAVLLTGIMQTHSGSCQQGLRHASIHKDQVIRVTSGLFWMLFC